MLLDPVNPAWLLDFNLFIKELETNFDTYDPKGEGKAKLKQLCMQEIHQAMKYFFKFQQLITCIKWGNAALQWHLTMD